MRSTLLALAALGGIQDPMPHDAGYSLQSDGSNRYEGMYGKPQFYSLELLVREGDAPPQQSIRTIGILYVLEKPGAAPSCSLCTDEHHCLSLDNPAPEIRDAFFQEAAFRRGDEAEVVGAFANPAGDRPLPQGSAPDRPGPQKGAPVSTKNAPPAAERGIAGPAAGGLFFWSFHSGPPRAGTGEAGWVSLESLVRRPDRYQKKTIAVRGLFRGRNLFGDMPAQSQTRESDWVLRDGPFFIWVTGKAPKGRGFALDLARRSDAAYRLEVEGQSEVRGGLVYLRAREVRLLGHVTDSPP